MPVTQETAAHRLPPSLLDLSHRLSHRLRFAAIAFFALLGAIAVLGYFLWQSADAGAAAILALIVLLVAAGTLACLTVRSVKDCLYRPLARVANWAAEIRQGNLSARIADEDELGGPVDDINRAADWLEALAMDKERELENQKSNSERKSRSLQLLYDVATGINNATEVEQLTARFMVTLADVVGARAASLRLCDAAGTPRAVADFNLEGALLKAEQFAGGHPRLLDIEADFDMDDVREHMRGLGEPVPGELATFRLMVVRLQYLERVKGVYLLFIERGRLDDSPELRELLVSIGRQLGLAVEKARLDYEAHLLPRMQERAMLANELHDSLAQTLASLRFQVRVLDDTLHGTDESAVWTELERIESSLEEANTELRELIRHFRAPVHRRGLIPAISAAVSRFRKESRINTFFQNRWDEIDVPDEWEVHVVRIVQEALANIRKHSRADNVRVLLNRDGSAYRVLIEDDGEGFGGEPGADALDDHFGLSIMRERAALIGGELRLESEAGEGTRIVLRFDHDASRESGPARVNEIQ